MPDPKTLYTVVAVVVVGLVAWVGFVLATVKQQWAREGSTELAEGTLAPAEEIAVVEKAEEAADEKVESKAKLEAKPEAEKADETLEAKTEEKPEAKTEEAKGESKSTA